MAKKDTKQIEQLLSSTKANRKIVRELIEKQGASLQHVYDVLGTHEQQFTERLKELRAHNAREEAADSAAKNLEAQLRTDGPTLVEFVSRGYAPENYPPQGYAPCVDNARDAKIKSEPAAKTDDKSKALLAAIEKAEAVTKGAAAGK